MAGKLTKCKKDALRKEVREALELRLDALDSVLEERSSDNIRYSMYCGQKLAEAIERYHNEQYR